MDTELLLDHEKAEHILREGWLLFQQKGYRGASVDELLLALQVDETYFVLLLRG